MPKTHKHHDSRRKIMKIFKKPKCAKNLFNESISLVKNYVALKLKFIN